MSDFDNDESGLSAIDDDLAFMAPSIDRPVVLPEVMEAVTALREQRALLDRLKNQYAEEKKKEMYLSRELVPAILDAFPTPITRLDLDTADGTVTVTVSEDVRASIPKDIARRASGLKWLSEQGGGSLIKDIVSIEDPSTALLDFLDAQSVGYARERNVNGNSLAAWFREKFGIKKNTVASMEVTEVSPDITVFRYRKTTIK